jgi:hypothetical protein
MSIQLQTIDIGLVRVTVTGTLAHADLVSFQRALAEQFTADDKTSVIVDARDFEGWEADGDWGDLESQSAMDPVVLKMAIVTDPKWENLAAAFTGKGLRHFPIEIFTPADYHKALAWASGQ